MEKMKGFASLCMVSGFRVVVWWLSSGVMVFLRVRLGFSSHEEDGPNKIAPPPFFFQLL